MKKKVVSALLCATMVATMFAGCGSKESDNNASTPTLQRQIPVLKYPNRQKTQERF